MSLRPVPAHLVPVDLAPAFTPDERRALELAAELAPEVPTPILERAVLLERGRNLEAGASALLSQIGSLSPFEGARAAREAAGQAEALAAALEVNLASVRSTRPRRFTLSAQRRRKRLTPRLKTGGSNPQIGVRLPPEVLAMIEALVPPGEAGRSGGVSHWIRCAVYEKLGLPEPPRHAEALSPRKERKRARIEQGDNAPAPLREAFLSWLERYTAGEATLNDTLAVDGAEQPLVWLLGQLWTAPDDLPAEVCDRLELPRGSTYARAARQTKATLQADEKRRRKDAPRFKVIPPD